MKRRDFLKAVAVSVGTLVVGCGPKDENNDTNITPNNTNNNILCEDGPLEPGTQFFPQSVASGDPSDSSVILWTRVEDGAGDLPVELQVAHDAEFTERFELGDGDCAMILAATAVFDNCVKVRLTGLDSATHYYYRFVYEKDGTRYVSNVGRTKTAPAPDADVTATFAFVSCQDYNGRFFNTYKQLVKQDDVEFFVHLGDYVYETTGDPTFQNTSGRRVEFRDEADAIVFNEGEEDEFFAAKSLTNYRDLYRIYRSDLALQRAHELLPCVAIWDDHEYSNDAYGATANYFPGQDELDETRKKNANQAWFEYMPVDYLDDPDFEYDPSVAYGDDMRIYRDIRWGKHTHLVMTDLRSYRADHVIAEDMFPGLVVMTQAELEAAGPLPAWADPYVDIDTYDGGSYATILIDQAPTLGYPVAAVTGNVSATYINAIVGTLNEDRPADMRIPRVSPTGLDAGVTAFSMGKISMGSSMGSRYFVVDAPFAAYAAKRYAETGGDSERTMGDEQESWFFDTMSTTDATWKVWGNEYCLVQRLIDLTALAAVVGPGFAKRYLLNPEDWDGMRNRRDSMISQLSDIGNVVAITGDVHAFFAGTPFVQGDTSKRIIEFVTSAVSSNSFQNSIIRTAESNDALREAGAVTLAMNIDTFLFNPMSKPNPPLAYGDTGQHGFAVMECDADDCTVTFHGISDTQVVTEHDPADLDEMFTTKSFHVHTGENELLTDMGGSEKRWDPELGEWV